MTEENENKIPKKISLNRRRKSEITIKRASGKSSTVSVVRKKQQVFVQKTKEDLEREQKLLKEQEDKQKEIEKQLKEEQERKALEEKLAKEKKDKELESKLSKQKKSSEELNVSAKDVAEILENSTEENKNKKNKDKKSKKFAIEGEKEKAPSKPVKTTNTKEKYKKNAASYYTEYNLDSSGALEKKKQEISNNIKSNKIKVASGKASKQKFVKPKSPQTKEILIPESISVINLAAELSVKASMVVKILFNMGNPVTINQSIDADTACLVVEELGHKAKIAEQKDYFTDIKEQSRSDDLTTRAPVVTVMGHVDHGKTTLLDHIRKTKVTAKEAGGITQHIGAYSVKTPKGDITFLDTPGHEAFSAMRVRGAKLTDIIILIVAADDGVMPQTIEAITHAKAAKVPIIVAVNKIDKAGADLDKIKNELSAHEIVPEEWGGDCIFVPISALNGDGIDNLLENINLQAELLELKASESTIASGIVLESKLEKGRGVVVSVLVKDGTLKQGDIVLAGMHYGKVRGMQSDSGEAITKALPSVPVEVLGFSEVVNAGEEFVVVSDIKRAKEAAAFYKSRLEEQILERQKSNKLELFKQQMQQSANEFKTLKVLIKADVQGSAEALSESLKKISNEKAGVEIVSASVGGLTSSDINLALSSSAIVIGFNVRADSSAKKLANSEGLEIRYYSVIYDAINDIKTAVLGLIGPTYKQEIIGVAKVKEVFRSSSLGAIAGCMVIEGAIKRGLPIRVLRDNVVIYEGELESLRRFKDDANEVKQGTECGIGVKNYNDIKVGDEIEVSHTIEVQTEL